MIRDEWLETTETLGGYPCIKHKYTHELCISGKYGDISEYSDSQYQMIIKPGRIQNKLFKLLNLERRGSNKDEAIISFNSDKLLDIVKVTKMPKRRSFQVYWANRFSEY